MLLSCLLAELFDLVLGCFCFALYALLERRIFGSVLLPSRLSEIFDLFSNSDFVHENYSLRSGQNDGGKQKTANPKVRRLGEGIFVCWFNFYFFAGAGRNIALSNADVFLLWNTRDQITLGHHPDRKASSGSSPSGVLMTV